MKKKLVFLTLPALLLVFGMALAGCPTGGGGSGGSGGGGGVASPTAEYLVAKAWVGTRSSATITMTFLSSTEWKETIYEGTTDKGYITGTYTVSGLEITFTTTGGTWEGKPTDGSKNTGTFNAVQATTITVDIGGGTSVVLTRQS